MIDFKKQIKNTSITKLSIIVLVIVIFVVAGFDTSENSQTSITQTPTPVSEKKELTSEQKSIQEFLAKGRRGGISRLRYIFCPGA